MIEVLTQDGLRELRAKEPKSSSEPITSNDLLFIGDVLHQRVTMRGGAGNSYWVAVQST